MIIVQQCSESLISLLEVPTFSIIIKIVIFIMVCRIIV